MHVYFPRISHIFNDFVCEKCYFFKCRLQGLFRGKFLVGVNLSQGKILVGEKFSHQAKIQSLFPGFFFPIRQFLVTHLWLPFKQPAKYSTGLCQTIVSRETMVRRHVRGGPHYAISKQYNIYRKCGAYSRATLIRIITVHNWCLQKLYVCCLGDPLAPYQPEVPSIAHQESGPFYYLQILFMYISQSMNSVMVKIFFHFFI